jgi:hypothetical protein
LFCAKPISTTHYFVIVKVLDICKIPKQPIKRKIFHPIFVGRLFSQMMMLLKNNYVDFLAMKDTFFVNKLRIGAEKWWATAINNGLEYGGGTGIALTTDMTLTFLSKGNGDGFYRPGREVKTGYLIYKTLLYTGFHQN